MRQTHGTRHSPSWSTAAAHPTGGAGGWGAFMRQILRQRSENLTLFEQKRCGMWSVAKLASPSWQRTAARKRNGCRSAGFQSEQPASGLLTARQWRTMPVTASAVPMAERTGKSTQRNKLHMNRSSAGTRRPRSAQPRK